MPRRCDDSVPGGRADDHNAKPNPEPDDADDDDAKPDSEPDDADDDDAKPDPEPDEAGDDDANAGRGGLRGLGPLERLLGNLRRKRAALSVSRAHAAAVEC